MAAHQDIETLIANIALGNRTAFSNLYDATSAKLLAICHRVLKDRGTAEEAMQEAYIKVWNNAKRYKVTGHSPMTWLITIARNTAIDRLRSLKVHDDVADFSDRIAMADPSPEDAVIVASHWKRTAECLEKLDSDRRQAIKGAYLQGLSYKELSVELDVPLNTMRTWLRRGLATLRKCANDDY